MTKRVKIAISLRADQVEAARRAVDEGRAASVSGYVSDALDGYWQGGSLEDLVRDLIAENGEPSAEAREWADQALSR